WRPFEEGSFASKQYTPRARKVESSPLSASRQQKVKSSPPLAEAKPVETKSIPTLPPTSTASIDLPFPNVEDFVASVTRDAEILTVKSEDIPDTKSFLDLPEMLDEDQMDSFQHITSGETDSSLATAATRDQMPCGLFDIVNADLCVSLHDDSGFLDEMHDFIDPRLTSGALLHPELPDNGNENVEEVVRHDMMDQSLTRLDTASSSSGSSISMDLFMQFLVEPRFSLESQEMIALRFDRDTCGVLSVKDGPTENPWRTLIWPLAHHSSALYHALASMTAFHTSAVEKKYRYQGLQHMRMSLSDLANSIAKIPTETAIATTLVLAFAESWDTHTSTGINHIRGAKILIDNALAEHRAHPLDPSSASFQRLKFLCSTWVYMNVLAGLTTDQNTPTASNTLITSSFDTHGFPPCNRPSTPTAEDFNDAEKFILSTSSPPLSAGSDVSLDPLMGCASNLFPLIGRIVALVREVRSSPNPPSGRYSNSPRIISAAVDLRAALKQWVPPSFFETPEDPTSRIQHSLQTAEAYRIATLLHLHRAVPEIPAPPALALAKKILELLATVPLGSRAVVVQIFPLMAAGAEVKDTEDRDWVAARWQAMWGRMRLGILERSLEVCREVWARRDEVESRKGEGEGGRLGRVVQDIEEQGMRMGRGGLEGGKRGPSNEGWDDGRTDPEYSVRGSLHWLGVMKDWNWEGQYICMVLCSCLSLTGRQYCLVDIKTNENLHDVTSIVQ
ncbi:hypothetical protein P152DRAFT_498179, partial [Eremomyces bilateralis CBS 781.70]